MLPDFLPAAEVLAKGVKHVASYVAEAIAERRNGFSDDEAGDYLRCAGADALAESFPVSAAADFPTAASADPAAGGAGESLLTAAGSLSDSELFAAAADVIETWIPAESMGDSAARWLAEFVDILRDRAAQFVAVEVDAAEPFLGTFNAMAAVAFFPQHTKPPQ